MPRPFARLSTAVPIAAALVLCAGAVAQAATKFDTSYQNAGTLQLPTIKGVYGQVAQTCDVSGKNLNIAGRFGFSQPGRPGPWTTEQQLATTSIKIRPRQNMMLGIAKVSWRKQRIPTGQIVIGEDFDSRGGFAYVTRSQRKSLRDELKLFRLLPSGRRDAKFGKNGYITIKIDGFDRLQPAGFRVIALPASKVAVLAQTSTKQVLLRFLRSGKPDTKWGSKGVVELDAPINASGTPLTAVDSATMTPDGGMLISANGLPGEPASGVLGVLKLKSSGSPDTSWAKDGYWTPPVPGKPKRITSAYTIIGQSLLTSVRRGGDFAVLYSDGAATAVGTAAELKLAYVDKDSGVTTLFNEKAGYYSSDVDGGVPDSNPWTLRESSSGTIFAHARGYYGNPGGTFLGQSARFSADADQQVGEEEVDTGGFATGAFAVDPANKYLYFCGSLGVTSSKTKDAKKRNQRKTVAVRRIKL